MAIVKSLAVGKARNSAGNVTFYNRMGETIMREKVKPTNTRTEAQMSNRVKFLNPVMFYKTFIKGDERALWDTEINGIKRLSRYQNYLKNNMNLARKPALPRDLALQGLFVPNNFVVAKKKGSGLSAEFVPDDTTPLTKGVIAFDFAAASQQIAANTIKCYGIIACLPTYQAGAPQHVGDCEYVRFAIEFTPQVGGDSLDATIDIQYLSDARGAVSVELDEIVYNGDGTYTCQVAVEVATNPLNVVLAGYAVGITRKNESDYDRSPATMILSTEGVKYLDYFESAEGIAYARSTYPSGSESEFYGVTE